MKRYSDNCIEMAIDLYNKGHSAANISSLLGPNETTIREWLKRRKILIRKGGFYNRKYSDEIINDIISLYKKGLYTTDIDKKLDLPRGVSCYLLNKSNELLNHKGPKSMVRNEGFFRIIDTEEKAYYLGWLMADGNVSVINNQYSIKIHIALKDRQIVDDFLMAITSSNKTSIRHGSNPSYYVSITSKRMCTDLFKYGIVPRKTGFEKFPKEIPDALKRHFIRGVFDGDGITDISKSRSGFVGSKELMEEIKLCVDAANIKLHKTRGNNIFYFLGGKKFSRKLYDYMYVDSTIYLERKKKRMQIICS